MWSYPSAPSRAARTGLASRCQVTNSSSSVMSATLVMIYTDLRSDQVPLQMIGSPPDPDLIRLPWDVPLEEWPEHRLVTLPRGISRHVVRFARLSGQVYAIKEINDRYARREYRLLWDLARHDAPAVEPVAVVSGRTTPEGDELASALITRHLQFSLPYRAVLSGSLRPETLTRLLDA